MIEPKLSEYIKNQYHLGTSNETIKSILIKAGWKSSQIDDAIKELTISQNSTPANSSFFNSILNQILQKF